VALDLAELDYLPEAFRSWGAPRSALLDLIVGEFLTKGTWPSIKELTRRLARAGRPVALADEFWQMPRALGWVDPQTDQPMLLMFAIRMTEVGRPILAGFNEVLRLAVERYRGADDAPIIRRSDLPQGPGGGFERALSDVLLREAPFLTAGSGQIDDDWTRDVTDAIVRYWDVQTPDDYLRIRADELRGNPQLGWGPWIPSAAAEEDPAGDEPGPEFIELIDLDPDPAEPAKFGPARVSGAAATALDRARGQREWVIGEPLGHGGFGQVFAARSGTTQAAIKFIPKDPGADRELLFVDLHDVANVVPIIDSGERDGFWFLVMPRADRSLRDRLDHDDVLALPEILTVLTDVADALAALDGRVVHRDLKPANILEVAGKWCLADFGISRYAEATTALDTRKHALSPPYAAPERWLNQRATSAADVYALGVIGFEMVAGSPPFRGSSPDDYREAHINAEPPRLDQVPAPLASLIDECLYKAAQARPSPANLRARLARAGNAGSPGIARLQQANREEVRRRSDASRRDIAAQTEAERRQGLLDAAQRGLAAISEILLTAITDAAPAAELATGPDGSWRLRMGRATLSLSALGRPRAWSNLPIDIIAVTTLDLRVPPNSGGYDGRSHSLWFGDVQHVGSYGWFESAFSLSAFLARLPPQDPFAMNPSSDAEQALGPGLHTHQVAWPFTPLVVDDLTDFVDRWASWFGDAADGTLHRPSTPERPADGSWRRS
jgi:eukaryotic-like serine/threonine-protein kinase